MTDDLTTGEVGGLLHQPVFRIVRVVDAIGGATRFAGKRVIPRALLPEIIEELHRRNWQPIPTEVAAK